MTKLKCMECGKEFSKRIPKSLEVECPKCGSYDVEINQVIIARTSKGILIL